LGASEKWHPTRMRLDVAFGSKGEMLAASRCFPLFTQQRTSLNRVGMSVRCPTAEVTAFCSGAVPSLLNLREVSVTHTSGLGGRGGPDDEASNVPSTDIEWLDRLPLMHADIHRLYVHAGVDPNVPLDQQTEKTLLWNRYADGFLFGFGSYHVVHGHDSFPDGPRLYEGRTNLVHGGPVA